MSWATVLKAGLKYMGRGAQATVKTVGHTALHPQQTIKGLGAATKTAAVGTAAGYGRKQIVLYWEVHPMMEERLSSLGMLLLSVA